MEYFRAQLSFLLFFSQSFRLSLYFSRIFHPSKELIVNHKIISGNNLSFQFGNISVPSPNRHKSQELSQFF